MATGLLLDFPILYLDIVGLGQGNFISHARADSQIRIHREHITHQKPFLGCGHANVPIHLIGVIEDLGVKEVRDVRSITTAESVEHGGLGILGVGGSVATVGGTDENAEHGRVSLGYVSKYRIAGNRGLR